MIRSLHITLGDLLGMVFTLEPYSFQRFHCEEILICKFHLAEDVICKLKRVGLLGHFDPQRELVVQDELKLEFTHARGRPGLGNKLPSSLRIQGALGFVPSRFLRFFRLR